MSEPAVELCLWEVDGESPLYGKPPLTEEERAFWRDVYIAFMAMPAHAHTGRHTNSTVPSWFADGAIVELRARTKASR